MATMLDSREQGVILHNISWDIYDSLLHAQRDRSAPRFTYDGGCLEIVSLSAEHEQLTETSMLLVNIVAEEAGINLKGFGSTTFRGKDSDRGFEPDGCFYGKNLSRVKGKEEIDLAVDPPPDLAIEIDITSSSVDKFSIMAQVGVPEVWRYEKNEWRILILQPTGYAEQGESVTLPALTVVAISLLVEESRTLEPPDWMRRVREWVRTRA